MVTKYAHTNIVAKDWKKIVDFYIKVFDCEPVYPERDHTGEWIEKLTNISKVRLRGIHLRLPGYENGPTLEIFEYQPENLRNSKHYISEQGYGHMAFHVDDVEEVFAKLIKHGGRKIGEIVKKEIEGVGILTAVYAEDPEGNCVEIQNWKK